MVNMLFSVIAPKTLKSFYESCRNPRQVQHNLLRHLIDKNALSQFGRDHHFDKIKSFQDFQNHVPVHSYEDLTPYIHKTLEGKPKQLTVESPVIFATTSGTTGVPKYIPVTPESKSAKSQLMRVWFSKMYQDHPSIFSGRILTMVSPEVESYSPAGIPCGSESGHGYKSMPPVFKSVYSCPYEVFELKDYDAKYYTLLRIAAAQSITLMYSVNPSTVLLLAQRLGEYTENIIRDVRDGTLSQDFDIPDAARSMLSKIFNPDTGRARALEKAAAGKGTLLPKDIWPDLKIVCCWKGGSVGMYLSKFDQYFRKDLAVRDIGYFSSENRGSVTLSDKGVSGVLAVPVNLYEFLPVSEADGAGEKKLLTADQLQEGGEYYIYVTTMAGLYRYDMNDIIKVTGFYENTPLIRFMQKGKGMVSFTGEKLAETQVIESVEKALQSISGKYEFIAAVGSVEDTKPRYKFLVEFDSPPDEQDLKKYAAGIEDCLGRINMEYGQKRSSGRILPLILAAVPKGEFNRYRQRMVQKGRIDGQFKILRLTKDESFAKEFLVEMKVKAE
jgi:hypothetical protein